MASSNPTTGVGVIAFVQVTGTGVTNTSNSGANGQGNGAVPSTNHPVAQYALSLSLSGTATCQLTTVLKDVANTTVVSSNGNTPVYKVYNTPSAPAHPATVGSPDIVATVSGSGLITAVNKGQTVVEVQFSTFDNTEGVFTQTGNPKDFVYAQIIVTVGV